MRNTTTLKSKNKQQDLSKFMEAEGRIDLQQGQKANERQHVCVGSEICCHLCLRMVLWGGKGTAEPLTAGGGFVKACGGRRNRSPEHGLVL